MSTKNTDKLKSALNQRTKDIEKKIIEANNPKEELDIIDSYTMSKELLGDYVTLDFEHSIHIMELIKKIENYYKDLTIKRPLNFIMIADSGFGKSHFIKSVANKMKKFNIVPITFNMANMEEMYDFQHPLEEIRNYKISDNLPLLFIDEFDSHDDNYAVLLPLMWDGELYISNQTLKLGKLVIILAGSNKRIKSLLSGIKSGNKKIKIKTSERKIIDLFSRINGGSFNIPSLDYKRGTRNRKVDKICIAISLLKRKYGEELELIPWSILKFIADTKFEYGVRSINYLIDLIPNKLKNKDRILNSEISLPLSNISEYRNSILVYHIKLNKTVTINKIISNWGKFKQNDTLVRVSKNVKDYIWFIDNLSSELRV